MVHSLADLPDDRPPHSYGTEVRFDDDPRMTPAWRERSKREGCVICLVKRGADRIQQVVADFQLR